ncbi:MAG: dTDP-4-dehydrorhamnose 3,5-epimerase [Candidatus Cloacimonetes bacterium]|nr:dTDP-4-dehydrorhamnose 3,5-epimerase [Candidatus Cloacimonadota bacterium]
MPFIFESTKLREVILIIPEIFNDERGFFMEIYKKSDFYKNGIRENFIQDNSSVSVKGVLRGLHYQLPPFSQGKLVRCVKGEIFDIAVDIRKDSSTFKKWVGIYLSENNKNILYIPSGFAHAFYTVSDIAEITYKTTAEYSSKYEKGIIWNDPEINIKLPAKNIILSEKDKNLPLLKNAEVF